ncbi:MAG: integration host factor subunit beta [Alphaproteobacteria bacterium]
MTKSELIHRIQEKYPELGRRLIEDSISLFFNEIATSLQKGHRIELRGFGSFCLRKRGKRTGRNPRTGETVEVSEKYVPFFKAGKAFRELLNTSSHTGKGSSASAKGARLARNASSLHSHPYGGHS